MAGLDEEIEVIKRLIGDTNELRLARIKSAKEYNHMLLEQP